MRTLISEIADSKAKRYALQLKKSRFDDEEDEAYADTEEEMKVQLSSRSL